MCDDGSNCLICHESFLTSPVGVLKCGHVYHANCVVCWLHSNPTCPQCKKKNRKDDVRILDLEVRQLPRQSPEELQRLEAATLEERELRREELATEKADADAVAEKVDAELADLLELAQEYKRQRRDFEQESVLYKEEYVELSVHLAEATRVCSAIRAGIDAEAPRLHRKLPIKQPREGDSDLHEERRKLRGFRPAERARQLHDALTSALQQENEKMRDKNLREAASKKVEDELRDLRQHEVQLRRELDERRSITSSQISSQASQSSRALPSAGASSSSSILFTNTSVRVEVATPHGVAELPLEDDEDAMFYGAAPARRTQTANSARPLFGTPASSARPLFGTGSQPARGTPLVATPAPLVAAATPAAGRSAPAGGKWGALFGSGRGATPTTSTFLKPPAGSSPLGVATTALKPTKVLFANRRA